MQALNILYLTPEVLFRNRFLLFKQWESIKTLIPCFLRSLYEGDITIKLHEFDKIFTGLKNINSTDQLDILAKVAFVWYYFTRITHQSVGPRVGSFTEDIIKFWMEKSNRYEFVYNNVILARALKTVFALQKNYKNRIDFIAYGKNKALFIELRMSEHTGGKTGQESLLDKFNKLLDLIASEELFKASLSRGIKSIDLIIAILFNEDQELIERRKGNFNRGRINSLINYMLEENHIWGRISKLSDRYVFSDGRKIKKSDFESYLRKNNEVCIVMKNEDFKIHLKILLGNEFFEEVIGDKLEDLIKKHADEIADDLWIMYTLTINELKIAKELGKTNVLKIYEIIKSEETLRAFLDKFRKLYNRGARKKLSFKEYAKKLNEIINELASRVLKIFSESSEELRLLETNDITRAYRYLRYICAAVLSLYLTLEVMSDKNFSACRW